MLHEATVVCPWCWVANRILVDCSAGDSELVEDCTVCCRPVTIVARVGDDGGLLEVRAEREND